MGKNGLIKIISILQFTLATVVAVISGPALAVQMDDSNYKPHLEHMAVWVQDIDKTAAFLQDALGWRRHSLQFGVDDDSEVFGGMELAFIDANGLWLELVEPTTPGPGMDFLLEKGKGALVELDFFVDNFDEAVAVVRAKGIQPMGMDGKPMVGGGLLSEWAIIDGKRIRGDERLMYFPTDVSRGTSVEIGWEYPNGVVILRDETWSDADRTPRSSPRVDHAVVLASDLEESAKFYTGVLDLPRHSLNTGIPREWNGIGVDGHAWIQGNPEGFMIEFVQPKASAAGAATIKLRGDGDIMELAVEVADADAFYDRMQGKGITMTAGDGSPLPPGKKAVSVAASSDRYSYFPLEQSEGMRIMVFQRGSGDSTVLPQPVIEKSQ
jgi:catechol 2,3-dioxygenase-like lactoylglutathione lyase family enzyme